MIVDAHQHFWRLARGDYRFPAAGDPVLYRDFLPDDLAAVIGAAGVAQTVLVQATDTIAESRYLLHLAAEAPFVAGVVGWWDPREPGALDRLLESPGHERLVGVRPMLQRSDDIGWLLAPGARSDLARIAGLGLAFDALVEPRHLDAIVALGRALPDLRIVVDHMGKPWRQPDRFPHWLEVMAELGRLANCRVKVSGFPLASAGAGPHLDLARLLDALGDRFGTGRLVWGSDWPVVEREGGYAAALDSIGRHFSVEERTAVFGGSARALYGLKDPGGRAGARLPGGQERGAAVRSRPAGR